MRSKKKNSYFKSISNSKWIKIAVLTIIITFVLLTTGSYLSNRSEEAKPTLTPVPTLQDLPPDNDLDKQEYVTKAVSDLINILKIDESQIQVNDVREREWPDTSLGCPQKNRFYAQVIVPGFVIELNVKDRVYTYHAGLGRIVSCQSS